MELDIPRWVGMWVVGLLGTWGMATWLRQARRVHRETRAITPAGGLNEGAQQLSGIVEPLQTLNAPLSGRPCAFFRIAVELPDNTTFAVDPDDLPFRLRDGSGECLVFPRGASLEIGGAMERTSLVKDLPPALAALLSRSGQQVEGRVRLLEQILPIGAAVDVMGIGHPVPSGPAGERVRAHMDEARILFTERHPHRGNALDGPTLSSLVVRERAGDPFVISTPRSEAESLAGSTTLMIAALLENVGWFTLTAGLSYGLGLWIF